MNCNLKRFGGLLTTLLVTSSFGFADSGEKSDKGSRQKANNGDGSSDGIYWEGKDQGMGRDAMAVRCFQNCFPTCPDSTFSVEVDFLYWASSYHVPFAVVGTSANTFTSESEDSDNCGCTVTDCDVLQLSSRAEIQRNKWSPGYRVGLGWNTGFDNWDVRAYYTYLHDRSTKHVQGGSVNLLWKRASADASLNYNVGDLEMGRTYYVSRYLVVRPFIGLRTAWLDQHFHSRSNNAGSLNLTTGNATVDSMANTVLAVVGSSSGGLGCLIPDPLKAKVDLDVWGIGPRFGFDTNWGNWHGLSLVANISTALLYGQTWTHAALYVQENGCGDDDDCSALLLKTKGGYWHGIPTLQTQFGLTWASDCWGCTPCVPCGQQAPELKKNQLLRFSAMWESNYWWNTNNFSAFGDRAVSLQGLTLSAKYDF